MFHPIRGSVAIANDTVQIARTTFLAPDGLSLAGESGRVMQRNLSTDIAVRVYICPAPERIEYGWINHLFYYITVYTFLGYFIFLRMKSERQK